MSRANHKDVAAGIMYTAIGLAFAIGATNYRLGTAASMGPGYFPFWLGVILSLVGLSTLALGLRSNRREDKLERWDLHRLLLIIGSAALFGILLRPLGFVISTGLMVAIASLASHEFHIRTTVINVVVLAAASAVLFVFLLGMRIPLWPSLFR